MCRSGGGRDSCRASTMFSVHHHDTTPPRAKLVGGDAVRLNEQSQWHIRGKVESMQKLNLNENGNMSAYNLNIEKKIELILNMYKTKQIREEDSNELMTNKDVTSLS